MTRATDNRVVAEPSPGTEPLGPDEKPREMLDLVVALAVGALPGHTEASVTIVGDAGGPPVTTASSSALAADLDLVQCRSGRGPCLEAISSCRETRAALPVPRWAELSDLAVARDRPYVWSLPLVHPRSPAGSMNIYSCSEPWNDPRAASSLVAASLAALVLAGSALVADLAHGNETLRQAIETRTVIGQAQGMLMARQAIGAGEAFDILRRASQRTNRKLRDIAAELVAGAEHATSERDPA